MVKRDSNIDILFRDGLNNMEALPPESVWDNIEPQLRKNNRGIFFKIAAGIAILTSLGLMAYFFTGTAPVDDNPLQTASAGELSTLFDANYLNIAVENNRTAREREVEPDYYAADTEESPGQLNDEMITKSADPATGIHRSVDLDYNMPNNTLLRFADAPSTVTARADYENLSTADIIPVEPAEEAKIKKWELGAMVSPTYLSTNLNSTNDLLRQVETNESPVLSYTGGLSISYRMTGRLSVQTGLYYSSLGREVKGVSSYSGFTPYASSKSGVIFGVETTSGTVNSTNRDIYLADAESNRIDGIYSADNFDPDKSDLVPFGNRLRQSFEYLQVPLILRYRLIDRKIAFNILGGMSYNFLVGNQTWAMNEEGLKILLGSTDGVDNVLFSSSLGMSMQYNLSDKLSINLEPELRYYLNTGGDLGSGNPYTFGVFSGMQLRF
jgi:hypothetical protein